MHGGPDAETIHWGYRASVPWRRGLGRVRAGVYQPTYKSPHTLVVSAQDTLEAEDAATAHIEPQLAGDEGPIHDGDVVSRLIILVGSFAEELA